MFHWFNNFKIRNKLLIAFLVMISLTLIVSVITLVSQNYIQTVITYLIKVDGQIAKLGRESHSALIMAERSEKEYLLRYKQLGFEKARTEYVNQVQAYIASIHKYMVEIRKLETEEERSATIKTDDHTTDNEEHIGITKTVDQTIDEYQTTFLSIVDLLEKRGHKNTGLEGQFRRHVHTVEEAITAKNLDSLTINLLTMRRFEKDYLLRNEDKYVTRLHESVSQFKKNVATSDLTPSEKEQLTMLINQYQSQFAQLVKTGRQIENLMKAYRIAVKRLEPLLEQIAATALLHENRTQANLQRAAQTTIFTVISASIVAIIIGLWLAIFLANLISKPLILIVQAAKLLSVGNIALTEIDSAKIAKITVYQDEIGDIGRAFSELSHYFKEVIEDIVLVSQGLAEESKQVMPQDIYRGDFVKIKESLETATTKLAEVTTKNITQDWFKTGQTQLNELMRGEQDIVVLTKNIISFLVTYIEAQVGLFYLLQNSNATPFLKLIASYAYTPNEKRPKQFLLGEGLVGEAALKQKTISFIQTPEECVPIIRSGLGDALPHHILLLPFLYENAVKGIVEIGVSKTLTSNQQAFLEQMMLNIGIAVNTAESRTRMQELLEQSHQQTTMLQSQQEEMQKINEELQSQREELQNKQGELQQRNEELQSQSEELQTQQEELRQTNDALEERSKDLEQQKQESQHKNLTLEKTQQTLEVKIQELEMASQYKSEFLANMSHELRTPLNSLLILSQLLSKNKDGNLSDKQVEYANTIYSAGSDLLKLINDILDLSKVEAGKMEIQIEELSLPDLIESMEHKFRPVAEGKGLTFRTMITKDLPSVLHTDAQRLQQIINNLLSNAFKFTSEGEVKLMIDKSSQSVGTYQGEEISFLAISVTDTGIGITKDKQQLIFNAFQQADGTTSRRYGGTGLGLSISRQLAQLLGGDIQLSSIEGEGSTFTLYLPETISEKVSTPQSKKANFLENSTVIPAKASIPQSTNIESSSDSSEEIANDDRNILKPGDKSLLIVEDDGKFSKILAELAREQNFKCLIAENGRTGLQLAEEYKPNAIILDVNLPQLDGWTVMDKLKDNPDTRHIPVHFISASDQSLMATRMGAIGFLHKPVSMEQLGNAFKKIEQFLTNTVKTLLLAVDSEPHQQQIMELVSGENIQTTLAMTTATVLQHLKVASFDCVILDMDIEQGSGIKLLEQMQQEKSSCQTPLIIYAVRDLTASEEALLLQCAERLPVKSVKSPERLLDEATLFLHQLETKLSNDKRNMLRMVHDKEAILKDKKVLIVDDDMRNVFALATVLEDKDMEVVVAQNGKEGLIVLEKHENIAIILMDIMMPEMDGYEAMQEIRKQPCYQKLPIIALTAKAMKGDKSKCIQAGASDYLSKPIDTDKLISLMRVWLYR
ncbi:response regulator [Candidatus Parabeggiatoa sp. HSG14]|uniref:response regulator n=1 Tax=Candidatus Parabeggiatoa sp. HSG14 TaxID=3055593 RepID=UPI0025A85D91|nr:response regulator [Thiotrichales bacterium HSG14]